MLFLFSLAAFIKDRIQTTNPANCNYHFPFFPTNFLTVLNTITKLTTFVEFA